MAGDHPDVSYVQAKKYGSGRPDGPPIWIVWHTTEEHEEPDTAEDVAHYFATLPDGRTVSSHYVHDSNSSVQCVRLADRAWTVGNTPGNNRGINVELAGFASQGTAGWGDSYSQAMLARACEIAARDMAEYGIPNYWCSVADLKAKKPGHTTHNDLRLAFGGTTHTDPGSAFPRQLVLDLVAGGGTPKGVKVLLIKTNDDNTVWRSDGLNRERMTDNNALNALKAAGHPLVVVDTDAQLADAAGPERVPGPPPAEVVVDVDDLVEALVPALVEALRPIFAEESRAAERTALQGGVDALNTPVPPAALE